MAQEAMDGSQTPGNHLIGSPTRQAKKRVDRRSSYYQGICEKTVALHNEDQETIPSVSTQRMVMQNQHNEGR